jgi:hypothetical protein
VMAASRPKAIIWPDDSTSSGNYGWLFVYSKRELLDSIACRRGLAWSILDCCWKDWRKPGNSSVRISNLQVLIPAKDLLYMKQKCYSLDRCVP